MGERTAVVIDRDRQWRDLAESVLATVGVETVAKAPSLDLGTRAIESRLPSVVVVEAPDDERTLAWLTSTTARFPGLDLIAATAAGEARAVRSALAAGAVAVVLKSAHALELAAAVRQLDERSIFLPGDDGVPPALPGDDCGLTPRELEILQLAAEGLSNTAIARRLWITEQTVKFHLANTYRKLGVSNRTGAARQAQLRGLFTRDRLEASASAGGTGSPVRRR